MRCIDAHRNLLTSDLTSVYIFLRSDLRATNYLSALAILAVSTQASANVKPLCSLIQLLKYFKVTADRTFTYVFSNSTIRVF